MTPELNRLINEINEKKKDRRIDRIKYALEAYLMALDQKEADEARKRAWFYQIKRWLNIN